MIYKAKRRAAEVFVMGIDYKVSAVMFEPGMEDGYRIRLIDTGNVYPLKKEFIENIKTERYEILGPMIKTVFGAVPVDAGDMVIDAGGGEKLVMKKEVFEEWYEVVSS